MMARETGRRVDRSPDHTIVCISWEGGSIPRPYYSVHKLGGWIDPQTIL